LPVAVVTGLVVGVLLGVAMLAVVIACLKRFVSFFLTGNVEKKQPDTLDSCTALKFLP
jgi:hypothetical protein